MVFIENERHDQPVHGSASLGPGELLCLLCRDVEYLLLFPSRPLASTRDSLSAAGLPSTARAEARLCFPLMDVAPPRGTSVLVDEFLTHGASWDNPPQPSVRVLVSIVPAAGAVCRRVTEPC